MKITFKIVCGLVDEVGPDVEISVNGKKLTDQTLCENNTFDYDVDNTVNTVIQITHKNKTDADTQVVDGEIVADKWLQITHILVDDIMIEPVLCQTTSTVTNSHTDSLYLNGKLTYHFAKNYFDWYREFLKESERAYIAGSGDPEAEHKYLGFDADSSAIPELVELLESHGYRITR